jgi:hypothetical protein
VRGNLDTLPFKEAINGSSCFIPCFSSSYEDQLDLILTTGGQMKYPLFFFFFFSRSTLTLSSYRVYNFQPSRDASVARLSTDFSLVQQASCSATGSALRPAGIFEEDDTLGVISTEIKIYNSPDPTCRSARVGTSLSIDRISPYIRSHFHFNGHFDEQGMSIFHV